MRLSYSLHQFRAQICHKPWRAKSLRLAAAYTSYGAADKILRRITAYEVYGGLRRLMAAARGSSYAVLTAVTQRVFRPMVDILRLEHMVVVALNMA